MCSVAKCNCDKIIVPRDIVHSKRLLRHPRGSGKLRYFHQATYDKNQLVAFVGTKWVLRLENVGSLMKKKIYIFSFKEIKNSEKHVSQSKR